jgi:hypothetical protein
MRIPNFWNRAAICGFFFALVGCATVSTEDEYTDEHVAIGRPNFIPALTCISADTIRDLDMLRVTEGAETYNRVARAAIDAGECDLIPKFQMVVTRIGKHPYYSGKKWHHFVTEVQSPYFPKNRYGGLRISRELDSSPVEPATEA